MARPVSRTRILRYAIQAAMVALVAWIGIRHQVVGMAGGAGPLDSFCPFGAVEALPTLLSGEGFIRKVGTSNLVLLGSLGLLTLGLSGSFCGWLCPFGALQDLFAWVGRVLLRGRRYFVPARLHAWLKHLRWAVLALIVWMSAKYAVLWFAHYDPFRAFFHFKFETTLAIVLVVVTVLGGVLVERFFCLYACPLGALVGGVGLVGAIKVRRDEAACVDCSLCARVCPSRISVDTATVVRDQHCTMCTECVEVCPAPGALKLSSGAPGESLRPIAIGVATVLVFFALIGTGVAMGWWSTGAGCAECTGETAGLTAATTTAVARLE